ncbi:MAG: transporter substrate-binding domain-containing protein [Desulfurivibrionaceae bacterium]|nr:transporter substrate-binding domain-containing protein [Desulfobulbales bacterium]MDT8336036.1 transporter substrate-binding domain-containing protein [Desulfurivibrionaceae bacterium]
MKKRITILALLFPLLCLLPTPAQATAPLKVGIYQNEPKIFVNERGKPTGIWVDLLEHIAEKEGWRLRYVPGTWQECLDRLGRGGIDLLPDVAYSGKRALRYLFNEENVLANWARVYTHESQDIESIEALRDKKVAVMKGDISFERFKLFNIPALLFSATTTGVFFRP